MVLPEGKPYQLVVLSVLREYLIRELKPYTMTTFEWDPERAIDDWVFINFFGMSFFFFFDFSKDGGCCGEQCISAATGRVFSFFVHFVINVTQQSEMIFSLTCPR